MAKNSFLLEVTFKGQNLLSLMLFFEDALIWYKLNYTSSLLTKFFNKYMMIHSIKCFFKSRNSMQAYFPESKAY